MNINDVIVEKNDESKQLDSLEIERAADGNNDIMSGMHINHLYNICYPVYLKDAWLMFFMSRSGIKICYITKSIN